MVIMSTSSPEVLSQFLGRTPTVFGFKIFEFFVFLGGGGGWEAGEGNLATTFWGGLI